MEKRQPSELLTWEELERMTPQVEVIEIKEEPRDEPPPFFPATIDPPKKQKPQA